MNRSLTSKNIDTDETWINRFSIDWLIAHKQKLIGMILVVLGILFFAYRWTSVRNATAENDFLQAKIVFDQFQKNNLISPHDSDATTQLYQMQTILNRQSELKPKYEGALAQTLLINQQVPEAKLLLNEILHRVPLEHLQLYQNYSQISLLLGEENYLQAIEQSLALKSTLEESSEGKSSLLYIFNLIRLGTLYEQTGNKKEENLTWEEVNSQIKNSSIMMSIDKVFTIGHLSLKEYIEEKMKGVS